MGWACGVYGWGEGVYRVLVGKPEGRRPLGRPRRRWADNIRMDLQEVGCGYMDWIWLAQDRDRWWTLVGAVMNLRVPWNAGNFLTSCKSVSFSRRTLHHAVSKCRIMCTWCHITEGNLFHINFRILRCGSVSSYFLLLRPNTQFITCSTNVTILRMLTPTSQCLSVRCSPT